MRAWRTLKEWRLPPHNANATGEPQHDRLSAEYLDALDRFHNELTVHKNASEHTVRNYIADATNLMQFLTHDGNGDPIPLADVEIGNLRQWLLHLSAQGASSGTLARRIAGIRSFFTFTTRAGITATNPASRLSTPKKSHPPAHRFTAVPHRRRAHTTF